MKPRIRLHYATGLLALSLLCFSPAAPSLAQVADDDPAAVQNEDYGTTSEEGGFDLGWVGLLGLIGLAGLVRRRVPEERLRNEKLGDRTPAARPRT